MSDDDPRFGPWSNEIVSEPYADVSVPDCGFRLAVPKSLSGLIKANLETLQELQERTEAHEQAVRDRQDIRDAWQEDVAALHETIQILEAKNAMMRDRWVHAHSALRNVRFRLNRDGSCDLNCVACGAGYKLDAFGKPEGECKPTCEIRKALDEPAEPSSKQGR